MAGIRERILGSLDIVGGGRRNVTLDYQQPGARGSSSSAVFNVKSFGARANGRTDDTKVCLLIAILSFIGRIEPLYS